MAKKDVLHHIVNNLILEDWNFGVFLYSKFKPYATIKETLSKTPYSLSETIL